MTAVTGKVALLWGRWAWQQGQGQRGARRGETPSKVLLATLSVPPPEARSW